MNTVRSPRSGWSLLSALAVATLLVAPRPCAASAGSVLYGCSGYGEYLRFDLTTGAATQVGYLPYATEIEYDPISGRAFAQLSAVFSGMEFNPMTGAAIADSLPNDGFYDGLEYVGSVLYGTATHTPCGASELRILDPWTGTSTLVGPTGLGPIAGLAYDVNTATMYGITGCANGNSQLLHVNLASGAATVIGSVGFEAGSLEFGPDGNLYGGGDHNGVGVLYRIDPATAATTLISSGQFYTLTGLMLGPECVSTHSQIQLAGTFTSPAYDLPASPNMTALPGCGWQATTHLDPGTYFIKFVTDGALDSPTDYGGEESVTLPVPGGAYGTWPTSGPGTQIRIEVLNPDDYTFTLGEAPPQWSATAALGAQTGGIAGSVDFEFQYLFPPYPVATVEFFRGATPIATRHTDRYSNLFSLVGLAPGDYRVKVSAYGYAPAEVSPVNVGIDVTSVGDVHLATTPSAYSSMNLAGDFNGFSVSADPMTQVQNGYWNATRPLDPGDYAFKFVTNGVLDTPPDYGAGTPYTLTIPNTGDVALGTGPETALHIHVDHAATYGFNLNELNLTFNINELPPAPVALDVNRVRMLVSKAGSFAWDIETGNAGLEYPKGTGKTALYAAGLWLSAGSLVAASEYSDEFQAGAMVGGGPDDPAKPEYKVYKLNRTYPTATLRDAALADYNNGAVPHGAPLVGVLPNGELNIPGDQMLWHVYNDADPASHIAGLGHTAPLGIEVQQTAFAFNQPGPLGETVYMKFKLLNKGSATLSDMMIGIWSDPDLGSYTDDLVGCDPLASLGYCYNGAAPDAIYGAAPPAIGFDLLQGPLVPGTGDHRGLTAFIKYINGTDPVNSSSTINYLHGLNSNGSPIVDPTTSQPTTFMVNGDPLTATGWLDANPSDRRMLLCSGPTTMSPGDEQEIVIAIVLAQGSDRLSSISALRTSDAEAQLAFDTGFTPPTAVQVSLVSTQLAPDRARLVWQLAPGAGQAIVYRATPGANWDQVATVSPDGLDRVTFEDTSVRPGTRYGYRLGVRDGADLVMAGETWVDVPVAYEFALHGLRPNPAVSDMWVSFSLPGGDAATLELLDLAGRRVMRRDVGGLGAGTHTFRLGSTSGIAPGVYLLRLRQGKREVIAKAAVIR